MKFNMHDTSSNNRATAAIEDLAYALKNPKPASYFLDQGTPTNGAFQKLDEFSKNNNQDPNHSATNWILHGLPTKYLQGWSNPSITSKGAQKVEKNSKGGQRIDLPDYNNHGTKAIPTKNPKQPTFSNYTGGNGNTLQKLYSTKKKKTKKKPRQ